MNDYTRYLFTLYYPDNPFTPLLKCAVKIKTAGLPSELAEADPMANREYFRQFLPPHVASLGPIVAVEEIFEIA